MRVLLDHCTPKGLVRALPEHEVQTARNEGWREAKNGDLLTNAEKAGYEVFITTDQGILHQQNMANRKIAVVVLTNTKWGAIRRRLEEIRREIKRATPGRTTTVHVPP